MNEPTDWVSAIAILTSGLVLGLLFVFFFSRRKTATKRLGDESDLARKDLEAKRDALIQQLRDLDENASVEERARLEQETADVLRKLDSVEKAPVVATEKPASEPAAAPQPSMNPAIKGFIWGAASFAAIAGLLYFVMQSSTARQEGGSVTGGNSPMQQQAAQQAPPNPIVQQLEAAVAKDPANLTLRNDLAQAYLETDNLMAVFEQTKAVLDKEPNNSRALTYQALVRMAMGEGDAAKGMLQQAAKSDPKNLDSWVALAWMYAQQKNMKDAEAMIAEAAKNSPKDKARLEDVFRQMKEHVENPQAETQVAAASGELPAGHPPVDGGPVPAPPLNAAPAAAAAPMQQRPVPADGRSVKVTLDLAPGATTRTGILYVMARNPMGGPPVAVKRLMGVNFPITFDFGSADSMMGQPLPDKFRLEARLDSDGDAATKPPTDPSAMQNDVVPGAVVKLALK